MVIGSLIASALSAAAVSIVNQVLLSAVMCIYSAHLARKLVAAERGVQAI
jgi:cell division protein FtsL